MSGWKSYLLMALVAVFISWLLMKYIIWKTKQEAALKKSRLIKKTADAKGLLITCPLCGSYLQKGEDLFSRVYRPMNVPHQLCTISGCPHCYPALEPGLKRECPVCHKQVPMKEGHLVARLFNYADGKKHVVVTGCTECCTFKD